MVIKYPNTREGAGMKARDAISHITQMAKPALGVSAMARAGDRIVKQKRAKKSEKGRISPSPSFEKVQRSVSKTMGY